MIDFDNVVLSKIDLLYLKTAKESDAIWLEPEKAACLLELGFIEPYLRHGGTHHFSITQDGRLFLNYQEHQEQIDDREQRKWKKENYREWIGIAISAAMSFAALIIPWLALKHS